MIKAAGLDLIRQTTLKYLEYDLAAQILMLCGFGWANGRIIDVTSYMKLGSAAVVSFVNHS